ncbi:MAG TPA: helix-turn-helix transcriptional regulator, partial [Nitrososphaeraceae archaeon]
MQFSLNTDDVIRIVKEHPDNYRDVLYKMYIGDRYGEEKHSIYVKLNNLIYRLRAKGMIPENSKSKKRHRIKKSNYGDTNALSKNAKSGLNDIMTFAQMVQNPKKSQSRKALDSAAKRILLYLLKRGKPEIYREIFKSVDLPHPTVNRVLNLLEVQELVIRHKNKKWTLTDKGRSEANNLIPFEELHKINPEDNFFYHLPMLIDHVGEQFNSETIAQRAQGYQGFYEKYDVPTNDGFEDFRKKILTHLENEALKSTFIEQESLFRYRATN